MNLDAAHSMRFGRFESDPKRCYVGFEPVNNSYKGETADIAQEGLLRPVGTRFHEAGPSRGKQDTTFTNDPYNMITRMDTVVLKPIATNNREIQRNSCHPLFNESHMIDPEFRGKDADTLLRPTVSRWTSNGENLFARPWDTYIQHIPNGDAKPVEKENNLVRSSIVSDRLSCLPSSTENELNRFVGGMDNAVEDWLRGGADTRNRRTQACAL